MLKTIAGYVSDGPTSTLVKLARRGLIGADLRSLQKSAGERFADLVKEATLRPGEVPVHQLALGTTEAIGPNRNGDGFKAADCRNFHWTFKKYAHLFRDHANDVRTDPHYGRVAVSHFNEKMGRIELLAAYYGDRDAASEKMARVADQELEILARGGDFPTSMSCRIKHDVCSGCDNKARNRAEYCDGGQCKYGGLKRNIGRTFDDGHTLHADNPEPLWFDQSWVKKQADRIAFALGRLDKAASHALGGAALAESLGMKEPDWLDGPGRRTAADALVLAEKAASSDLGWDRGLAIAGNRIPLESMTGRPTALAALADAGVILGPEDYLRLASGDAAKAAAAGAEIQVRLPGIFAAMEAEGTLCRAPDYRTLTVDRGSASWAKAASAGRALDRPTMARSAALAVVRGLSSYPVAGVKLAATPACALARHYALYQVAALDRLASAGGDVDFAAAALCRRNRQS